MEDVGHLYVLANSAMPGFVKVGKTTRSPEERAKELSSATGMPTPFIVVYEQLFENCSEAEDFVHTFLAAKGFRVSDNREFFSAPVNDIVRAIVLAPGAIDGQSIGIEVAWVDDAPIDPPECSEGDSACTNANVQKEVWMDLFSEALAHYYGLGDELQDYPSALRLFSQAARLGSTDAFRMLGRMYNDGEGTPADRREGLKYFKEGARKGNVFCYWDMGMIFWLPKDASMREAENAEKCFSLFRQHVASSTDAGALLPLVTDERWGSVSTGCYIALSTEVLKGDVDMLPEPLKWLIGFNKTEVSEMAREALGRSKENPQLQQLFERVIQQVEKLALAH